VYGINKKLIKNLMNKSKVIHKMVDKSRKFYRISTKNGYIDIYADTFEYYKNKGFLPLWLVLSLRIEKKVKDCYIQSYCHGSKTRFPISLEINPLFMRFLGLFVSEGHIDKRQIGFTFGKHENHLIDEVFRFTRVLGLNTTTENRERSIRIKVFGGILSILMEKWCGKGAKNKHIPEFVFRTVKNNRAEFLKYLYLGDGHFNQRYSILNTSSKRLANEVSYLWLMQGVVPTLSKRKFQGLGKHANMCYMVYVFNKKMAGKYEMVPSLLLNEFGVKKECLFSFDRAFEILGLGPQKNISKKYYKILSNIKSGCLYNSYQLLDYSLERITNTHINHLCRLGYIHKSNGMLLATKKIEMLFQKLRKIEKFINSDLCLLQIKSIKKIRNGYDWVYDISVPKYENFIGGLGGISCHNSRGQQGLGVSCGVLYSQLTTGSPVEILSSTGDGKTHRYKLKIDVKKNEPKILSEDIIEGKKWHGVQISFICEGLYREHKQSVLEYLKETAISNPYANIVFESPTGKIEFKRGVENLPPQPKEIKPHLYGVEVGILSRMLHDTKARTMLTFLTTEFTRIGRLTANEICKLAEIDPMISPRKITDEQIVNLVKVVKEVKLTKPPTDCLSPLGSELIENGLKKELDPEWVGAICRSPTVYRGWPFQVECGIGFGGSISEPRIMRFANRVPLLYQQGDCVITKAISSIDWKRYGVEVDKLPIGPIVIFVHLCSVWVPFTSESKEAIASYPVILKEVKLALQDCARKLSLYLSGVRKARMQAERKSIFERYADESAKALSELTGEPTEKIKEEILKIVESNIGSEGEKDEETISNESE
jgi:DNA topoisomerase VI B subunit